MSDKIVIKSTGDSSLLPNSTMYGSILATLIENIDLGIHIVDSEGATIFYNQAMADLEGLDIKEVMGRNILEIFPSLTFETSTLLTVLNTKKPMINRVQNYVNSYGGKITTTNSTIPIFEYSDGFFEIAWNEATKPGEKFITAEDRLKKEKNIKTNKKTKDKNIIGAIELAKNITREKELSEKIEILRQELAHFESDETTGKGYTFQSLIGSDENFLKTIENARKASMSSSTVLIYGETGTGKELFAQSIHYSSDRKDKPLIAQNCAALPETLLEGILFGTVKGGFTGAINRPGLFEQADGGTLILDEINSMGFQLQAKLLRVLQEGTIRRIGGLNDIPVDVRIIATTNEQPETILKNATLRKDLYYRLNVISLNIPPLRDRISDLPLLSEYFIKKCNRFLNKDVWYMSNEVKEACYNYNWPGNVRELENMIEGGMNMLSMGHVLKLEHLPNSIQESYVKNKSVHLNFNSKDIQNKGLDEIISGLERELIEKSMLENEKNVTKSAASLGIKRQTLQHKIKKYGIEL